MRENILFGLKVREPARDYERRLQRVAGLLGLGHLLDRKPSHCPAASSSAWRWAGP